MGRGGNDPVEKWAKDKDMHFTEQEIEMSNKHERTLNFITNQDKAN